MLDEKLPQKNSIQCYHTDMLISRVFKYCGYVSHGHHLRLVLHILTELDTAEADQCNIKNNLKLRIHSLIF